MRSPSASRPARSCAQHAARNSFPRSAASPINRLAGACPAGSQQRLAKSPRREPGGHAFRIAGHAPPVRRALAVTGNDLAGQLEGQLRCGRADQKPLSLRRAEPRCRGRNKAQPGSGHNVAVETYACRSPGRGAAAGQRVCLLIGTAARPVGILISVRSSPLRPLSHAARGGKSPAGTVLAPCWLLITMLARRATRTTAITPAGSAWHKRRRWSRCRAPRGHQEPGRHRARSRTARPPRTRRDLHAW